jgi:hypothetical protein
VKDRIRPHQRQILNELHSALQPAARRMHATISVRRFSIVHVDFRLSLVGGFTVRARVTITNLSVSADAPSSCATAAANPPHPPLGQRRNGALPSQLFDRAGRSRLSDGAPAGRVIGAAASPWTLSLGCS